MNVCLVLLVNSCGSMIKITIYKWTNDLMVFSFKYNPTFEFFSFRIMKFKGIFHTDEPVFQDLQIQIRLRFGKANQKQVHTNTKGYSVP